MRDGMAVNVDGSRVVWRLGKEGVRRASRASRREGIATPGPVQFRPLADQEHRMVRVCGVLVRCAVVLALLLSPIATSWAAPKPTAGVKPPVPKPAVPAAQAPAAADVPAVASFDDVPLFDLAGKAGLPAYLKASPGTWADE